MSKRAVFILILAGLLTAGAAAYLDGEIVQPRGVRNNNPGNLRPGPAWAGLKGDDGGGYSTFYTPFWGLRAASDNLKNYTADDGINTLQAVANRWAPSGDNNDPGQYAGTLSIVSGFGVDDTIDLTDPATNQLVLKGIVQAENGLKPDGGSWYTDGELSAAVAAAMGA
jgi:hypothetical protein